ncbi:cobalamin-independent synthase, Catalytic domain protein [Mycobacterium xenopi 3993]|nr:cobalamin-independent synthase, Catalytic domain protein [Mycobacterium xenopi 3993]
MTALTPVDPIDEALATAALDTCAAAAGADVLLHSCASSLPWNLLCASKFHALSIGATTTPHSADLDGIAEFIESGRTVMLGVVPATTPRGGPPSKKSQRPPWRSPTCLVFLARRCVIASASPRRAAWPVRRRNGPAPPSGSLGRPPRLWPKTLTRSSRS